MDLRPTRQTIVDALNLAGITFPEQATITQLRNLYKTLPQAQIDDGMSQQTSDVLNITAADVLCPENNSALPDVDVNNSVLNANSYENFATIPISSGIIPDVSPTNSNVIPVVNNQIEHDQLERELKILQMRCEIKKLQNELQSFEGNSTYSSNGRHINYDELNVVIQKFSGDDQIDIVK